MDNDSQCKLILFYLKEHGSITAKEAMQLCGCMRLAARIHDLRKKRNPHQDRRKDLQKQKRVQNPLCNIQPGGKQCLI